MRIHTKEPSTRIARAASMNVAKVSRESAPPTLMRLAPASASCAAVMPGSIQPLTTLNRPFHCGDHVAHLRQSAQSGRVEHVSAGRLIGLQPAYRVGHVVAPADQILRPRGEQKRHWQAARDCRCRAHPRHRQVEVVNRVCGVAGEIFDRAADRARLGGEANCLGRCLRRMCETVFQVGIHRQVGCRDDVAAIGNHVVARNSAVGTAEHVGEAEACGRERFEAERSQELRRAGIPRVGHDKGAASLMQGAERHGFVALARHGAGLRPHFAASEFELALPIRQMHNVLSDHQDS